MTDEDSIIDTRTVVFDNISYSITDQLIRKFGFLSGMLESGLFDILELPLPQQSKVAEIGHDLLRFLVNNPETGMNYLQHRILEGLDKKEYIKKLQSTCQNKTIDILKQRDILAQVLGLVVLADYWDCPIITKDCTEFLALCLSVADTQTVKEWFAGII
jgi:hypothetical protein